MEVFFLVQVPARTQQVQPPEGPPANWKANQYLPSAQPVRHHLHLDVPEFGRANRELRLLPRHLQSRPRVQGNLREFWALQFLPRLLLLTLLALHQYFLQMKLHQYFLQMTLHQYSLQMEHHPLQKVLNHSFFPVSRSIHAQASAPPHKVRLALQLTLRRVHAQMALRPQKDPNP